MSSFKVIINIIFVLFGVKCCKCSVVTPAVAPFLVQYAHVAPQSVLPFAASVNTFTKGLNVYAAPYAAGVLSAPALVSRTFLPAPAAVVAPSPLLPAPFARPAPILPAAASPFVAAPAHVPYLASGPLAPAPFALHARSVHAAAPLAAAVPAPYLH